MKNALYKSMALHIAVVLVFTINLPLFWNSKRATLSQVPIIVDLKDVKLAEMTNLPPKAKFGKEDKAASTIKRKMNENYKTPDEPSKPVPQTRPEEKGEPADAAVDDGPATPVKQDFLEPPKASSKPKTPPKPSAKPKPPAPASKPGNTAKPGDKEKPALANPLKSLLASVDTLERNIGNTNQVATIKEGTEVNNMGIEGGTGGSYFSELTISEIDAIAGRLRACWNLDPGAKGAQNMIVEIRAFLNKDGTVRDTRIIDSSRYNSDPHFRSVADSARRAVYICAPYGIFSEKYADKYDLWNTMLLRFNPLDGNVN
ncbi:MAG: hypothetical protein LBR70_07065 [Lactobacillaceae bacterium]|jgi:hypothetical protein|nr:hypothetical protein [Lactobacillaceae bacterium]